MAEHNIPRKTNDSKLARIRIARGLKQGELAKMIHTTQNMISGWESGTIEPRFSSLQKLAKALNVDISELVD